MSEILIDFLVWFSYQISPWQHAFLFLFHFLFPFHSLLEDVLERRKGRWAVSKGGRWLAGCKRNGEFTVPLRSSWLCAAQVLVQKEAVLGSFPEKCLDVSNLKTRFLSSQAKSWWGGGWRVKEFTCLLSKSTRDQTFQISWKSKCKIILPSEHVSCFHLDTESRMLFVLPGQTVVYMSLLNIFFSPVPYSYRGNLRETTNSEVVIAKEQLLRAWFIICSCKLWDFNLPCICKLCGEGILVTWVQGLPR